MPLVTLRKMLDHAASEGYAVPAFNINSLEQVRAIMEAASKVAAPVILQVSSGGRKHAGARMIAAMVQTAALEYPTLPIVWHQDHGHHPAECFQSIREGYTSVMMDGSLDPQGLPRSLHENIAVTKEVVHVAHAVGVSVEGEIGCLGRKDQAVSWTDVEEAITFVDATGVDALAIAIGTSHGAYKFSQAPTDDVLSLSRLAELHAALPNTHFVLHGSSSIPKAYHERFCDSGGILNETYGVPIEQMVQAMRLGVRKFNIDTDMRLVTMTCMREFLSRHPEGLDPRALQKIIMRELSELVQARYEVLGCFGQADRLLRSQ